MLFPDANRARSYILVALRRPGIEGGKWVPSFGGGAGETIYTLLQRTPYIMWLLPRWNEVAIKVLEPFAVADRPGRPSFRPDARHLSDLASFALFMSVLISIQDQRARRMDMNDAVIEQPSTRSVSATCNSGNEKPQK